MPSRRQSRELALQLLFLWDAHGAADPEMTTRLIAESTDDPVLQQRAREMADGAWAQREKTDAWIERIAPQWPPRRQPGVDRGIIRLAVWELLTEQAPPKVAIDEAIELAKHFSTEQSPSFINGVLDAVLREQQQQNPPAAEVPPPVTP